MASGRRATQDDSFDGGLPDPDGGRGRVGRNLPLAIAVGLLLGALVLAVLYLVKHAFVAVAAVAITLAMRELTRGLAWKGIRVPIWPLIAGGAAMFVTAYAVGPEDAKGLLLAFALTVLAVLVWRMPAGVDGYVRDVTAGVLIAAYIPFLASFAMLMLAADDGAARMVTFLAVAISSDVGGYFAGILFGRHRMSPMISPKKTWEGFAGSTVACVLCGMILVPVLLDGAHWQGVVLGLVTAVTATTGDLVESMVKRDLGVKDMGGLLPGHGGVMDRLDSLLATAPFAWLLLTVFVPS